MLFNDLRSSFFGKEHLIAYDTFSIKCSIHIHQFLCVDRALKTHQDRYSYFRAAPYDQQQGTDEAHNDADFDVPEDGKDESEQHEKEVLIRPKSIELVRIWRVRFSDRRRTSNNTEDREVIRVEG